ncbi:hypothetical protein [Mangrovimonas cancribranchiae]
MTKFNNLKYLLLGAFAVSIYSCSSVDNDVQDYDSSNKPQASALNNSASAAEGEIVTFTINLDKATNRDSNLFVVVDEDSEAIEHEDFEILLNDQIDPGDWGLQEGDKVLTIPAYSTSIDFSVELLVDDAYDLDEEVKLKVLSRRNMAAYIYDEIPLTIDVTNTAADYITMTFDWERTFTYNDTEYSLCEVGYDNDFILADADFNLLSYLAATADCPEQAIIPLSLGEGDFHVFQTLYENASLDLLGLDFNIPITVSYLRGGTQLSGSYVQTDENAYDTTQPSDPGLALPPTYVISFNITGDVVTIFDVTTGETLGSGRQAELGSLLTGFSNLPARNK